MILGDPGPRSFVLSEVTPPRRPPKRDVSLSEALGGMVVSPSERRERTDSYKRWYLAPTVTKPEELSPPLSPSPFREGGSGE